MRILVVHENGDLCRIWCRFLQRSGFDVSFATSPDAADALLGRFAFDVLVLEPEICGVGGLSISDIATFRNPDIRILAVTGSTFFSDGTIFSLMPNARGVLRAPVRLEDLGAYLDHFNARDTARGAEAPRVRKV